MQKKGEIVISIIRCVCEFEEGRARSGDRLLGLARRTRIPWHGCVGFDGDSLREQGNLLIDFLFLV